MSYRNSGPWTLAAVVRLLLVAALVVVLVREAHSGALPRTLCPWLAFASTDSAEGTEESHFAPIVFPEESRGVRTHSGD